MILDRLGDASATDARPRRRLVWLLAWAALLTLAAAQEPLYSDNQNTKFLHGLAAAGYGNLDGDWLYSTFNVFPVFTAIVYTIYRFASPYAFHLAMVPLMMAYLAGLLAV